MKTIDPRRNRARTIVNRLARLYPDAKCALEHENPLQLLIATILSAQCTDKRVNLVTPGLFARYRDARSYASAQLPELEQLIKTCGLYRSKAKNIIAAAQALVAEHGGEVPKLRAALEDLPGVGR